MRSLYFVILSLFFSLLTFNSSSQTSLKDLRNAGIKSESDLRKIGVSDIEIREAKEEFFKSKSSSTSLDKKNVEVNESEKKPEEKKISTDTTIYVSSKINEKEIIYGHSIFRDGAVNIIKNSDRIKAPDNYRLVAGDEINITIWGYSEFSGEFIIGESGNITPKLVGRINLKGKTFRTAKKIIKSRFGKVYDLRNSQIAIDLSYSKVISVNVIGEVVKPGSYSVPSLNSASNILSLAGGPTDLGSVRSIEIRRNGKLFQELDVYTFMFFPRTYKDQFLQDGDFLIVNPRKGVVEINGEVKRPGLYEFKEGDKYSDILKFCGGFSSMANIASVNITRVHNNQLRMFSVKDVLNGKKDFKLINGDKIEVLKVSSLVRNSVSIVGAVNVPGHYPYEKGLKISNLITSSKGLTYQAFEGLGHVYRLKDDLTYEIKSFDLGNVLSLPDGKDNFLIQEFDQIIIFNKDSFINEKSVIISGMINAPGSFDFSEGMTLEDLVLMANGLKLEADLGKIEIERISYMTNGVNNYIEIIPLSYPVNKKFILNAFDKVHFRKLPGFSYQKTIELKGEFKYPGTYTLTGENDKISDLIKRAGGLTEFAFLENGKILRKENDLGLLLLNFESVLKSDESMFNYILKPGDIVEVPKINDIVTISGAIGYQFVNQSTDVINSPFHKAKRASFYIEKYGGGYDKEARRSSVYVIAYNGLVKESKYFGLLKPKIGKGDKIVVKYKDKKLPKKKEKIDWDKQIDGLTVKIMGLATLWVLLSSVQ